MLEKGRITSQQLLDALECQNDVTAPIGAIALEQGLLTPAQIRQVLDQQRKKNQRFTEAVCEMGFLKQAQIDTMLQGGETPHRLLLGEALVWKGSITPETLDKELKEYHKESERVGAEI
ncbi:MAG TPA: hypothetical protein VFQ03_10820, partial [Candidatus Binatia bacterium]|nr:hypothetical protein [Candidatus Binatia bacterium]